MPRYSPEERAQGKALIREIWEKYYGEGARQAKLEAAEKPTASRPAKEKVVRASGKTAIFAAALALLNGKPMRFSELVEAIRSTMPDTPANSITGALVALNKDTRITKPERGVYALRKEEVAA